MAEVLRNVNVEANTNEYAKNPTQVRQHSVVLDEQVAYIPIKEINLDDNGLKDEAFAFILSALAT